MADEPLSPDAEEQSALEKIAGKFGFPAQGDDTPDQNQEIRDDAEFAEIEFEGAKYQVPAKLKGAFLQNADYTQKTQGLAERTRQMDHMREVAEQDTAMRAFAESVAQESQEIAVIDAYLKQAQSIDWSKMSMEQMFRQRAELDNVKERKSALQAAITEKRGKFTTDLQTKIQGLRAKAREMAAKSITGFSEDTEKAVRAYASAEGLAEREIDGILLDPRSFTILWKASQFDKIKAGTGKAQEATARVLKPGAASERMPKGTAARLNFNKAMNGAKTSGQKADVIATRLATNSIFSRSNQ